jgi:mRNA interferase RelE/StbE
MGRGQGRGQERGPQIPYTIEIESRARRDYLSLPPEMQTRISAAIDDLATNPRPPGAKRLVGQDGYRLRQGDYRILYTVDDQARIIRVYRIGHRRDIYRRP